MYKLISNWDSQLCIPIHYHYCCTQNDKQEEHLWIVWLIFNLASLLKILRYLLFINTSLSLCSLLLIGVSFRPFVVKKTQRFWVILPVPFRGFDIFHEIKTLISRIKMSCVFVHNLPKTNKQTKYNIQCVPLLSIVHIHIK